MTTSDKQIWLPLNLVFVQTEHANLDCGDVRNNNNKANVEFMSNADQTVHNAYVCHTFCKMLHLQVLVSL